MYETAALVDINEWITMRIEVQGEKQHCLSTMPGTQQWLLIK